MNFRSTTFFGDLPKYQRKPTINEVAVAKDPLSPISPPLSENEQPRDDTSIQLYQLSIDFRNDEETKKLIDEARMNGSVEIRSDGGSGFRGSGKIGSLIPAKTSKQNLVDGSKKRRHVSVENKSDCDNPKIDSLYPAKISRRRDQNTDGSQHQLKQPKLKKRDKWAKVGRRACCQKSIKHTVLK